MSSVTAGPRSPRLRMPFVAVVVAAAAFFCFSVAGCGAGALASTASVSGPASPSTVSAFRIWNSRTASTTAAPYSGPGLILNVAHTPGAARSNHAWRSRLNFATFLPFAPLPQRLRAAAHLQAPAAAVTGLDRCEAIEDVASVVAAGGLPVGVAAAETLERAACAGVVRGAGVLDQVLAADALLLSEAQVRREHRRRELRCVGEPRRRPAAGRSVAREPVSVEAVVDLEEAATVTPVAADVLHVRLARRDGEQETRGQLVARLGFRNHRQPPARARLRHLTGKLIGADLHGALPRLVRPCSTLQTAGGRSRAGSMQASAVPRSPSARAPSLPRRARRPRACRRSSCRTRPCRNGRGPRG